MFLPRAILSDFFAPLTGRVGLPTPSVAPAHLTGPRLLHRLKRTEVAELGRLRSHVIDTFSLFETSMRDFSRDSSMGKEKESVNVLHYKDPLVFLNQSFSDNSFLHSSVSAPNDLYYSFFELR